MGIPISNARISAPSASLRPFESSPNGERGPSVTREPDWPALTLGSSTAAPARDVDDGAEEGLRRTDGETMGPVIELQHPEGDRMVTLRRDFDRSPTSHGLLPQRKDS